MNDQLTFPSIPKKICGTCQHFEYVGAFGNAPWGKCYKDRCPGNHFDPVSVYRERDCWIHDVQTEARTLIKEILRRYDIDTPELRRLEVLVDR